MSRITNLKKLNMQEEIEKIDKQLKVDSENVFIEFNKIKDIEFGKPLYKISHELISLLKKPYILHILQNELSELNYTIKLLEENEKPYIIINKEIKRTYKNEKLFS